MSDPTAETEVMFQIIYPETKRVTEKTIRMWFSDAVHNGECEALDTEDVYEMARQLDIDGCITLVGGLRA